MTTVGEDEEGGSQVGSEVADEINSQQKNEAEELFLPDHTVSMRQAGQHCLKLWQTINNIKISGDNKSYKEMLPSKSSFMENQHEYLQRREDAKRNFWTRRRGRLGVGELFGKEADKHLEEEEELEEVEIAARHHSKASSIPVFHFDSCTEEEEEGTATLERPSTMTISSSEQRMIDEFQQKYQHLNIPCLVTGLDRSFFGSVDKMWKKTTNTGEDDSLATTTTSSSQPTATTTGKTTKTTSSAADDVYSKSSPHRPPPQSSKTNRQWFLDYLGEDFKVPLRYDPAAKMSSRDLSSSGMDDDGRAVECQTKFTTIKEWIEMLEEDHRHHSHHQHCLFYLKDWHFQQHYENIAARSEIKATSYENCGRDSDNECENLNNNIDMPPLLLYTRPTIFAPDLLNAFLMKFTDGDYRFLYWGPKGSFTGRHSDVIHSFSWSYNVVGVKEWTFFPPNDDVDIINNEVLKHDYPNEGQEEQNRGSIKVRQEAGQAIFVPATWQHEVVNLEESISLNHNWISTSNLDLSWDCIVVEIEAIQTELLNGWWTDEMITSNRLGFIETCENMLRGCVGLDLTSFFLMTLSQLLLTLESFSSSCRTKQQQFDIFRLLSVLHTIMELDAKYGSIEERVEAILQSDELTVKLIDIARVLID